MFEKLVVSTAQRRKHTTAKFFLGTSALYAFALACALVISVLASDPRLADTGTVLTLVGPPPLAGDQAPKGPRPKRPPEPAAPQDYTNVMRFDSLLSQRHDGPPPIRVIDPANNGVGWGPSDGPAVSGTGTGVPEGRQNIEPPPKPDPPKPKPAAQTPTIDNKPVRVTSNVLQGKALARLKPTYPPLARQIRLQGDVSVEVIISPEGRVESARVVSGHPMFAQYAKEAALGWRFEPTLLNNVPVRVTGVITFVFKLNE